MTRVRWDPTRELDTLQGEMNRLFSSFFDTPTRAGSGSGAGARRWVPAMDLVETQDHIVLRADLPGMTEDDVTLEIEKGVLTISGERSTQQEVEHAGSYRLERATGSFSRSLTLPDGVDVAAVAASYANGVLEVRIPKPAQAKPRRIAIGASGADHAEAA